MACVATSRRRLLCPTRFLNVQRHMGPSSERRSPLERRLCWEIFRVPLTRLQLTKVLEDFLRTPNDKLIGDHHCPHGRCQRCQRPGPARGLVNHWRIPCSVPCSAATGSKCLCSVAETARSKKKTRKCATRVRSAAWSLR